MFADAGSTWRSTAKHRDRLTCHRFTSRLTLTHHRRCKHWRVRVFRFPDHEVPDHREDNNDRTLSRGHTSWRNKRKEEERRLITRANSSAHYSSLAFFAFSLLSSASATHCVTFHETVSKESLRIRTVTLLYRGTLSRSRPVLTYRQVQLGACHWHVFIATVFDPTANGAGARVCGGVRPEGKWREREGEEASGAAAWEPDASVAERRRRRRRRRRLGSEARCGPRARLKGTERATRAQYARDIARPVGIWGPQLRPRFAQSRQISRRAHNPPSVNILCHRVRNAKSSECGLWDVCRRSTGTLTTATPDTSPYYVSPYGRSERGGWTHLLDRSGTLGQFLLANFLGASFWIRGHAVCEMFGVAQGLGGGCFYSRSGFYTYWVSRFSRAENRCGVSHSAAIFHKMVFCVYYSNQKSCVIFEYT